MEGQAVEKGFGRGHSRQVAKYAHEGIGGKLHPAHTVKIAVVNGVALAPLAVLERPPCKLVGSTGIKLVLLCEGVRRADEKTVVRVVQGPIEYEPQRVNASAIG